MSSGKLLVQQVKDLVVVNLEIAALHDEDAILTHLSLFNLLKEVLKTLNQNAFLAGRLLQQR